MSRGRKSGSSEDQQEEQTKEDEIMVKEAVENLRELVAGEKNLRVRMDDLFMLRYLRANEFKPRQAFDHMLKLYKFKAKYEDYFAKESPLEYRGLLSQKLSTILEKRDERGRRLFVANMGNINTDTTSYIDYIKLNDLWMELLMDDEDNQKNGVAVVWDTAGLPLRLFRFLTPRATIIFALKEEMRPWTNIEYHVVNTSKLVNVLVKLVFPLLGAKIKERIHFHGQDWASLHKFVSPEVLPKEYGGQISDIDFDKMQQHLFDNEKKLTELFSLKYKQEDT